MLRTSAILVLIGLLLGLLFLPAAEAQEEQVRLKELVTVEGAGATQLTGYGVVVGLDRTGDRARGQRSAPYTVQSVANMLQQYGISIDPSRINTRNAAAVMVTADLNPFKHPGGNIDVTVSAMGDAQSLSGGVLLQTPLLGPQTDEVYAMAQGPVSTGAVLAEAAGARAQINNTNTGRIPGGGTVEQVPELQMEADEVGLMLRRPDFTNAERIAEAIEELYPDATAVMHAGLVRVDVPDDAAGPAEVMADIEELEIEADTPARVVVNERTGTIVAGGNTQISEVMVTHGSVLVTTRRQPVFSQPPPFADGEALQDEVGEAAIDEEGVETIVLDANTDVNELADALNELGLTARDVIAIFQAIDDAGALQAELVIQ